MQAQRRTSLDLYAALAGRPRPETAVPKGRPVARFVCPKGHELGRVHVTSGGKQLLYLRGMRLPPLQAACAVVDAALIDLEESIAAEDLAAVVAIDEFVSAIPEGDGLERLRGLASLLPALDLPAQGPWIVEPRPDDLAGRKLAGMDPTCGSCRTTFYLGDSLDEWLPAPAKSRASRVVVAAADPDARRVGPVWPAEALRSRVVLYSHLTAVLASQAQF